MRASILPNYNRLAVPAASADGRTVVWIASDEDGARLFINGTPGPLYDEIYDATLRLSNDGAHDFYLAGRAERIVAVRDGQAGVEYDNVGAQPVFSADGAHVAYSAKKDNGKHGVVLDGVEGPDYDHVVPLQFSDDGLHFAYRATENGQAFFVVDGKPQNAQFEKLANEFVFAPGGSRFAYAAVRNKQWHVVVDGVSGSGCAGVFGMTFSSDGRYFAKGQLGIDGQVHVFVDGQERWAHIGTPVMGPRFSADGTRLVYVIARSSRQILVVDGVEGQEVAAIGDACFSPDARHLVYSTKTADGRYAVYLDEQLQHEFDSMPSPFRFTAAGELLYCAVKDTQSHMVLDVALGRPFDRIYLTPGKVVPLRPDGSLEYTALQGSDVVRIRHLPG